MAGRSETVAGAVVAEAGAAGPHIRRLSPADLRAALAEGWADFLVRPSHYVFLALVYPVAGLILTRAALHAALVPLVYPLIVTFALIGPVALAGVFELSRRIEAGEHPGLTDALAVLRQPLLGRILAVAALLVGLAALWLVAAWVVFQLTLGGAFGDVYPRRLDAFLVAALTTAPGWQMVVWGNLLALIFAALALAIGVFSVPMLVDGEESPSRAVLTSLRAVAANPGPMALWGVIVAAGLALGALTLFVGLIVVLPVLGHATWRLYRRTIMR